MTNLLKERNAKIVASLNRCTFEMKTNFLQYHDKIYVFDEVFVQAVLLKLYDDDKLTKHFKTNKTVKLFVRKYY